MANDYARGHNSKHNGPYAEQYGGLEFIKIVELVSGTSTYPLWADGCPFKLRVIDMFCIQSAAGGAADTATLKNGSDSITNDLDLNKSDKVRTGTSTIDDAFITLEPGDDLNIVTVSDATAIAYVRLMRV